jgi:hypothetical protein
MGNLSKIVTTTVLSLLVLSGCSATSSPVEGVTEAPTTSDSWADLNACNAFQEIVWAQDNSTEEALTAIGEQRSYLLESVDAEQEIIQETIEYLNLVEKVASRAKDKQNFLEAMVQQDLVENYENLMVIHQKYATFCDSIGFSILDDSFLTAERVDAPSETVSAEPSPSDSTTDSVRCFDSMRKASLESNSSLAERYLKETAEFCGGEAEWYQALRKYPYAMGFPDVMGNELDILCYNYGSSPACRNP